MEIVAARVRTLPRPARVGVDGVFLHHPDLRDLWDLTIFIAVDRRVALERALARDEPWMENARERYATRYLLGETRYLEEVDPSRSRTSSSTTPT